MGDLPNGKSPRMQEYDYNDTAVYFTTICVQNRECLLSSVVGTPVPTTKANSEYSKFISTLKRFCNKEYGYNIWQSRSYDHVIRDYRDYEKIKKYIHQNPLKWELGELYCEN